MLAEAAQVTLTRRYQTLTRRLATTAGRAVATAWADLGTYDPTDIATLAGRAGPVVDVLSARAAASTAGYLAVLLEEPVAPTSALVAPDWDSAFIALRRSLANGHEWPDAVESGRLRAEAVGSNAVVSTARRAADEVPTNRIIGWRRLLSGSSCTWCSTVATQRYHSAESADFGHDHCHCEVAPIIGDADPGRVINAEHTPLDDATRRATP